jgi:hypothetical protein
MNTATGQTAAHNAAVETKSRLARVGSTTVDSTVVSPGTGAKLADGTGARIVGHDGEQSRARYPDSEGFVERGGQRLFYEVYGEGKETIFLLPTWSMFHSRHWKMQIPYLARHFRVLAMDGLGNGRSDRPSDPRPWSSPATVWQ